MAEGEVKYTLNDHVSFVEWAESRGLEPYLYHGRFFWHGPAVNVDSIGEVQGLDVEWQMDQMGLGFVVYPVTSDPKLEQGC